MPEGEPPAPEAAELYDLVINGRYGKLSISKENEKSQKLFLSKPTWNGHMTRLTFK